MPDKYEALVRGVTEAGFFTNGVEDHGTWDRTCISSKLHPDGCLTGISFWVSRLPSGWYLGVWGGSIYRMANDNRLLELCISWLSRVPTGTRYDFDDQLKAEFGLVPVHDGDFDKEAGIA